MKRPTSSRFQNDGSLPDLKLYAHYRDGKQVLFNNQATNISYHPFNGALLRCKTNFPADLFNLQSKITIDDTSYKDTIPAYQINDENVQDPISLIDSLYEVGATHGAIKLVLPEGVNDLLRSSIQINPDQVAFQSNKLLNNPPRNELESRMKFHNELFRFHASIREYEMRRLEEATTEDLSSVSRDEAKSKITMPFLKLPMIDKRPLDLYRFFRSVLVRGGFLEVISKKLWAQIGRELGYKGKIMTSLSSSLKATYSRILYPFEVYLNNPDIEIGDLSGISKIKTGQNSEQKPFTLNTQIQEDHRTNAKGDKSTQITLNLQHSITDASKTKTDSTDTKTPEPEDSEEKNSVNESGMNESKKRHLESDDKLDSHQKKQKVSFPPLIVGSAKAFRRSIKIKAAKGFPLNAPRLLEVKPPNAFTLRNLEDAKETTGNSVNGKKLLDFSYIPITQSTEMNHVLNMMFKQQSIQQDEARINLNSKSASVYTLRQFMEKDLKFQEYILEQNRHNFNQSRENFNSSCGGDHSERDFQTTLDIEEMEQIYSKFVLNEFKSNNKYLNDGLELESGANIPSFISSSGHPRLGDDLTNFANYGGNNQLFGNFFSSPSWGSHSRSSHGINSNVDSRYYNSEEYISKIIKASLHPWNLYNIPILPNSLFATLGEGDINNKDMTNPTVNIGMTFSTENWKCEDHFAQLCNYHFFGACKKWYFVPEQEKEKFEKLIEEVNQRNKARVNINNQEWDLSSIYQYFEQNKNNLSVEYEAFYNSLENMINTYPDYNSARLKHRNSLFQLLIDFQDKRRSINYNQEFMITPEMMREAGIRYTSAVQRPGEIIIKFPKVYSSTRSFGVNVSEEVNFVSKKWLSYAAEAERWLRKQSLLPNFLVFKLLVNFVQLYEAGSENFIFNAETFQEVLKLYNILHSREIELRRKVREKAHGITEVLVDPGENFDYVADDDLANAFPSKITLKHLSTGQSFILSLESFLSYLEINEDGANSGEESLPDIINSNGYTAEMQMFYSDERLKSFGRILSSYSIDYSEWMKEYEELPKQSGELTLRAYKNLLTEGEKINFALNSTFFNIFQNNKFDSQNLEDWMTSVEVFKTCLQKLRNFVNEANDFIEECQSILSVKHQQRIRNTNSTNSLVASPNDLYGRLLCVVEKMPKLNFTCPEMKQVWELSLEIQNFEKACNSLVHKEPSNSRVQEYDELINLGKSFGLNLPSLYQLKQIRNKIVWFDRYRLIIEGRDPYGDKKEIFFLHDLKGFLNEGLKILDRPNIYLEIIQELIQKSELCNKSTRELFDVPSSEFVPLEKLDPIIKEFQEKSTHKVPERLFMEEPVFERLLEFKENEDLIEKFRKVKEEIAHKKRLPIHVVRTLISNVDSSPLHFDTLFLYLPLKSGLDWVEKLTNIFSRVLLISAAGVTPEISSGKLQQKFNINNKLLQKMQLVRTKNKTSFSLKLVPLDLTFEDGENVETDDSSNTTYCICREYEFGGMIECDKCNEWYHLNCIKQLSEYLEEHNFSSKRIDEVHYKCPICRLIESNRLSDSFLNKQVTYRQLTSLKEEEKELPVFAANELNVFNLLMAEISDSISHLYSLVNKIKLLHSKSDLKVRWFMLLLRKVYGAGTPVEELLIELLSSLHHYRDHELLESHTNQLEENREGISSISDEHHTNQLEDHNIRRSFVLKEHHINQLEEKRSVQEIMLSDVPPNNEDMHEMPLEQNLTYMNNQDIKSEADTNL